MWLKYTIETNIKRSTILFNLFQIQRGVSYVVGVLSHDNVELISAGAKSHLWRRKQ
jgi:hypothetical protein